MDRGKNTTTERHPVERLDADLGAADLSTTLNTTMEAHPASSMVRVIQQIPTSTVHQARLQLYQPTRRPQWAERKIQTPWGTATVRGKLGQVHADIVEALCFCAEDHRILEPTGHLQLLVDPYRVRVSVGAGQAYSKDTLWRMLLELREASITLEVPRLSLKVMGGILDRVEESPATRINNLTGKPRQLWRVTFDPAFAAMLAQDLSLNYNPRPLASVPTGVAQAIARHILTHRDQPRGGWSIDQLIELVGAGGNSETMRNRRRDVKKSIRALADVGIAVHGDRLMRASREPEPRQDAAVTSESMASAGSGAPSVAAAQPLEKRMLPRQAQLPGL